MYDNTDNLDNKKALNKAAEKIRIAMVKNNNTKASDIARELNCTTTNISNKLKRNNFSESDMRIFADILGYDVEITLISRTTGERI